MNGRKVLVTGGAGYVGSHACKALAARGCEPVVFDSLENGHAWAVKWGPLEQGGLEDAGRLAQVIEAHQPDAVLHFAAYAYVGESMADPSTYYRNNVAGTLNLLDAMKAYGVPSIVFSSTCATYGVPAKVPIREDAPQEPINPYGRSKLMMERIMADYSRAYGLRVCSLRYFNAAGADPEGEIGEAHDPEPHLIPNVLRAAAGGIPELDIFGDDYPTPDGTCVRDFIHVTDLAEAHCLALDHLDDNPGVHAFNLGSDTGYSIMEVIRTAEQELGLRVPHRTSQRRPGDPPVLVADSTRAREGLGWQRRHSNLTSILRTAWHWEQSRREQGMETG